MRAAILINPRSGQGRAARVGAAIERTLLDAGHETLTRTLGRDRWPTPDELRGASALVVVGGDGTVHHAAGLAVESGTPLYHAASGNENLFARAFDMRPDPREVRRAIEEGAIERIDRARCNGVGFVLMCSAGPDASVIHRLSRARRRPTGHLAYAWPILAEAFSPRIPWVNVWVDGRELVCRRRGMVVIANMRQYALRIDPCQSAEADDARLDVTFLPCTTSLGTIARLAACRARVQGRLGAVQGRGTRVRVEIEGDEPKVQLDGEAPPADSPASLASVLDCAVDAGALPVLTPPSNG